MAGISYLLDQANRLERPIVICIGMGTNMGNHGGDSRLGYMMDRYSGIPGVCMVVPADNEENARHHFYSPHINFCFNFFIGVPKNGR